MFQTNITWLDNKEKKLFEAKMEAYDWVTNGCEFRPKLNNEFNQNLEMDNF